MNRLLSALERIAELDKRAILLNNKITKCESAIEECVDSTDRMMLCEHLDVLRAILLETEREQENVQV